MTDGRSQESRQVLIIDDQLGEILWLLDRLRHRGYETVVATNEEAGRRQLEAVKDGRERYAAAIIDVMVAIKDLEDLLAEDEELDDEFFEESTDTGIRLCRYARRDLSLSADDLPIACLTVREDDEVKEAMKGLGIPLYNRIPQDPSESIVGFLEQHLPPVGAEKPEPEETAT